MLMDGTEPETPSRRSAGKILFGLLLLVLVGAAAVLGTIVWYRASCPRDAPSDPASRSGVVSTPPPGALQEPTGHPYDDRLRLNHIQMKGTHNSYHIALDDPPDEGYDYTHAPLDVQLSEQGVRQVELDVHYRREAGFLVYHSLKDPLSTCERLVDCLQILKTWSDDHPGHHALFVLVQPYSNSGALDLESFSRLLDADLLSVWPRERVLTPDDLKGDYRSLREAVCKKGWPTLGETRNKAVFIMLDAGVFRDAYSRAGTSLEGRVMFVSASLWSDMAAFVVLDHALWKYPAIRLAAAMGFMVRTRSDNLGKDRVPNYCRLNAALLSGAHMISTDYPEPVEGMDFHLTIPGGRPSRCNPRTAPKWCIPEAVENLPMK